MVQMSAIVQAVTGQSQRCGVLMTNRALVRVPYREIEDVTPDVSSSIRGDNFEGVRPVIQ